MMMVHVAITLGNSNMSIMNKFSIDSDSSSNTVTLNGQNVQPEDTAVYYCARRDTVRDKNRRIMQKLLPIFTTESFSCLCIILPKLILINMKFLNSKQILKTSFYNIDQILTSGAAIWRFRIKIL